MQKNYEMGSVCYLEVDKNDKVVKYHLTEI